MIKNLKQDFIKAVGRDENKLYIRAVQHSAFPVTSSTVYVPQIYEVLYKWGTNAVQQCKIVDTDGRHLILSKTGQPEDHWS